MELGFSAEFMAVYGAIQTTLIVTVIQFVKKKIPGDYPAVPVLLTYVLSFGVAYGLTQIPGFETATIGECILLAFVGQAGAQLGHSVYKTYKGVS